jgi:MSHA biogenesis protein MshP
MSRRPDRQAGVGLVTAIFLLVVIAGLAAAMVTVFTAQQAGSQLDQQGTRAYQAARAGIEWGLFRARQANSCASSSFALPTTSMLSGFTVTVTCRTIAGPGGDAALTRTVITAVACNQPVNGACTVNPAGTPDPRNNLDYVQRRIEVQL